MASKATGHRQGDLRRGAGPVGGTLLDEWYQWRRTPATLDDRPPTGGGDDHAVRLPSRRGFTAAAGERICRPRLRIIATGMFGFRFTDALTYERERWRRR